MTAPATALEARHAPRTEDDEAFVMPAAGFFADLDVGFGHVHLPDEFAALDTARQLKILADWKSGIDEQVTRTLVREFRAMFPGESAPLPERLREFRARCERQGIPVPEGFVIALQRH